MVAFIVLFHKRPYKFYEFLTMFINALMQLAHFMRQGKLVPDEAIFSILSKRLEQKIEHKEPGFIIDGFPRTLTQAVRRN